MKLPGGKGGSFPVEGEEASQWKGRKFPGGEGGSFTAGREKVLQWKVMKLFSGKNHGENL